MILADTSIWIDHLRKGDSTLEKLLDHGQVLTHPFVIGELAVGNLRKRALVLGLIGNLPKAAVATSDEALKFIDRHRLFGRGIGYVDTHLLAAVALTPGSLLWTRDKRLRTVGESLSFHAKLK